MSRKYLVYLLIAAAVALAGCAFIPGLMPGEPQAGDTVAPLIALPGSDTPGTLTGQAPTVKPFDIDRARWMEYRLTDPGQPGTATVRIEYAAGGNTVSIKRTQASSGGSIQNTLGGGTLYSYHSSSSQSSMTSNTAPVEQVRANDPILYADDITASTAGAETVIVPIGTYDSTKYNANFKGANIMYWGATGIPVPVKIYTACDGITYELVDWG